MEGNAKQIWKKGLIVIIWLLIWQGFSMLVQNTILVAGPVETLKAFVEDIVTPVFWFHVGNSLLRILAGFFVALILGIVLALLSHRFGFIKDFLTPFMMLAKAVPVAAFAVMLLIWWGSSGLSFAISFLVCLPIFYVNFLEGISHVDGKMLQTCNSFDMSIPAKALYLYRPTLVPFMESALKTSLGMSIKAGVAAEVIGMPKWSIGTALYESKIYLETAHVFSWTIVVILLGMLLEKIILTLFRAFCAWKPACYGTRRDIQAFSEIRMEGLAKQYGATEVLKELYHTFPESSITCIMSPSGSGKTTLLHILAGLTKKSAGNVEWKLGQQGMEKQAPKQKISEQQAHKEAAENIRPAFVFQEDRLFEEESALRNVELVSADRDTAESVLYSLLPKEVCEKAVLQLSGGMKRRVALARALAAKSHILFLDEPFTGLDEENRRVAIACIKKYQNGRIIILATHDEGDARLLGGEVWKMS